jgi:hypothetical protein
MSPVVVLAVAVAVIAVLLVAVLLVGLSLMRRLPKAAHGESAAAAETSGALTEKDRHESSLASLRSAAEEATAAVDEARAAAAAARTEAAAAKAEASAARAEARRVLDAARAEADTVLERAHRQAEQDAEQARAAARRSGEREIAMLAATVKEQAADAERRQQRLDERERMLAEEAERLAEALLALPGASPAGLGARDSLRLEAGLCLYGHDIDASTSPVEAGLTWSIQKRRREEGGFPGAARIQREIADGPARLRVGLKPEGRAPAREGSVITTPDGREVGIVTSGGFGASVNGPVAMGYVAREVSAPGTELHLVVRGKAIPARVVPMPFAPHRYKRG